MRAITKLIFLNEENEKFFGEGPYQLLKKVEETGSLHAAANELGMAYSKATRLLYNAEKSLGFPFTVRRIGGKAGGGSVLTPEAKEFMERYGAYRAACRENNERLYKVYFEENGKEKNVTGCVIMASGLGKRFGGNKLMVELCGKPMIAHIIEATEGLFDKRVVVTRNEAVKKWCEARDIAVVYHALPDRNDTIRLGLTAIEEACEGDEKLSACMFCPADMPFVSRESLKEMLALDHKLEMAIVRMAYQGKQGAPVLFSKDYFEALKTLPKGKGGSEIIKKHLDQLSFVEAKEECELLDMDTREDYEVIKSKIQYEQQRIGEHRT